MRSRRGSTAPGWMPQSSRNNVSRDTNVPARRARVTSKLELKWRTLHHHAIDDQDVGLRVDLHITQHHPLDWSLAPWASANCDAKSCSQHLCRHITGDEVVRAGIEHVDDERVVRVARGRRR